MNNRTALVGDASTIVLNSNWDWVTTATPTPTAEILRGKF
jgi:hypothetical protein